MQVTIKSQEKKKKKKSGKAEIGNPTEKLNNNLLAKHYAQVS